MDVTLRHDESSKRYELFTADGRLVGYLSYEDSLNADTGALAVRDFQHTVVLPEFRGQGISRSLIARAIADTETTGAEIVASCSAVAHYLAQQKMN
ncbi:MAG: GNAT family N-acetyltransferase [Corynebacterium sp.]|nr:GNAT family N-acetyltransferase [Corynebacterium sp.]